MSLKQIHPSPLVFKVVLASVSQDKTVNSSIVAPRNYSGELENMSELYHLDPKILGRILPKTLERYCTKLREEISELVCLITLLQPQYIGNHFALKAPKILQKDPQGFRSLQGFCQQNSSLGHL